MKIDEMNLEEVEARLAEIASEIEQRSDVELSEDNSYEQEITELQTRKAQLVEAEERKATAKAIEDGKAEVKTIERKEEIKMSEERKIFGVDTPEYRDAFFANLVGKATAEQRAIFADNTAAGDGLALPVTTDQAIWDQVLTAHPILADISVVKSGVTMKVTQMTPSNLGTSSGVKGKKDSDTVVELTFTSNEKMLAGKDYTTYVTLSYAESKMSAGAMEKFLVAEIAGVLGELLAKDVFASIVADVQSVTKSGTYFEAIGLALAAAPTAVAPVIYANSADYYAILKEVDTNGQPIVRDGVVLGATLKKDTAATKITVVDPAAVICNVISDTSITSQEMVSKGGYDIGGYMRAEACIRKTASGAYIA